MADMKTTRPRLLEDVRRDLYDAQWEYQEIMKIAVGYFQLDTRPILVYPESGVVERVGPDPVPQNVRAALQRLSDDIVRLRLELHELEYDRRLHEDA
jgi:hypothetical protein